MRFLESTKILTTHASIKPNFTISDKDYFNQNVYGIELNDGLDIYYFICLLNSNLTNFFIKNTSSMINGGYYLYKSDYLKQIPIIYSRNQQPFVDKANAMLSLTRELQQQSQKFQRTIQRKFELEILPKKLQDWYLLTYSDFVKELTKQKVRLSLNQEAEWEDYFTAEATKVLALKSEIDHTDKEIDAMVYKLYDLTAEEIAIVENS